METEGGAATDTLTTINGGVDGQILILSPANTNHDIVVESGAGNILLGANVSMATARDTITLMKNGLLSAWVALSQQSN